MFVTPPATLANTWAVVTSNASEPMPFFPPMSATCTSQKAMVASGAMVMFASTSPELTNFELLVCTWLSATPFNNQVAAAPLVNPDPSIWTSTVVPWSPYEGLAEETLGPEGALAWSAAPVRTPSTRGPDGSSELHAPRQIAPSISANT